MKIIHALLFSFIFIIGSCTSKKQLYADRLMDNHNRHLYVNDSLDFSISYFDVIGKKNRQIENINLKKTTVPVVFQKHLKNTIKKQSEILFQAHRASMSDEDIIAVLYSNKGELIDFSKNIVQKLLKFVPKDSLQFQPYETATGYLLNTAAYKDTKISGSDFIQKRSYNALTYKIVCNKKLYKFHEFHVPFNSNLTLRLIWIADIQKTLTNVKQSKFYWEKIDEQNHHLELFSLNDSAKHELREIVPTNPFQIAQDAFKERGYLGAVRELETYEKVVNEKGTLTQKNDFYQCLMTFQSFSGDHKSSLQSMDIAVSRKSKEVDDTYFDGSEAHDAAEYIIKKVENQQVVMFNEAHNCGQNRAFMREILRGCYENGFRHLALEALNSSDNINERGYPLRLKSGIYTNEPTFGQMLREAKSIGFQLHSYENDLTCLKKDCRNFREARQTENLKKILDKEPNAKVLVWAGHGHIYENDDSTWQRMAYRFKKLTGIDPLTIEQTQLRETSSEENDPVTWKAALHKWQFKKPIVVTAKDTVFVVPSMVGRVDMQVFFPRTDYTNDYPHWMGNSDTHFYELSLEKDYFKEKLLVIFIKKEYEKVVDEAVPVMNIPLSRIGKFKLFLKPDQYVAVVRDAANWEFLYQEFEVKQ
jgi:hypothetical protein